MPGFGYLLIVTGNGAARGRSMERGAGDGRMVAGDVWGRDATAFSSVAPSEPI